MESEQMLGMVGLIDPHAERDIHDDDFLLSQEIVIQLPRDRAFSWDVDLENDVSGELLAQRALEAYEKSHAAAAAMSSSSSTIAGIASSAAQSLSLSLAVKDEKTERERERERESELAAAKSETDEISEFLSHFDHIIAAEEGAPSAPPAAPPAPLSPSLVGKPPLGRSPSSSAKSANAASNGVTTNTTSISTGRKSAPSSSLSSSATSSTSDLLKMFDNSNSIYLRHDLNQLDASRRAHSLSSSTTTSAVTSSSANATSATTTSMTNSTTTAPSSSSSSSGLSLSLSLSSHRSPHMVSTTPIGSSLGVSGISNIMHGLPANHANTHNNTVNGGLIGRAPYASSSSSSKMRPYGSAYGETTSSSRIESSPYMLTTQLSHTSHTTSHSNNTHSTATLSLLSGLERRVGAYTIEERRIKIEKFRERKRQRQWKKQIKYDCRKRLADTRPRVKGRFVSRKNLGAGDVEAGMSPETREFHDAIMDMPDGSDEEGSMGSAGRHGAHGGLSLAGLIPPGMGPNHLLSSSSLPRMHSMSSLPSTHMNHQYTHSHNNIHTHGLHGGSMMGLNSVSLPNLHDLQGMGGLGGAPGAGGAAMVSLESADLDLEMTLPNNFLESAVADIEALLGAAQDGLGGFQ